MWLLLLDGTTFPATTKTATATTTEVGGCLAGLIGVVRNYVERHNVLITMASNPNVPTVQCQVQCAALCLT